MSEGPTPDELRAVIGEHSTEHMKDAIQQLDLSVITTVALLNECPGQLMEGRTNSEAFLWLLEIAHQKDLSRLPPAMRGIGVAYRRIFESMVRSQTK